MDDPASCLLVFFQESAGAPAFSFSELAFDFFVIVFIVALNAFFVSS